MTVDQIAELKKAEPSIEREGLSGSINFASFRPLANSETAEPEKQDLSQPIELVDQPQDLPEEPASQVDEEKNVTPLPRQTKAETPFDLVEERRRRAA